MMRTTFAIAQASGSELSELAGRLTGQLGQADLAQGGLGIIYLTESAAGAFEAIAASLNQHLPGIQWVGAVADGIIANESEYSRQDGAVAMVLPISRLRWQIFSGTKPLTGPAHTALVHADPAAPDVALLIEELAGRTETGYLFGGLTAANAAHGTQIANNRLLSGGLSGVGFSEDIEVLTRVTQGCAPLAGEHQITECRSQFILGLDGQPALDVLLGDLGVEPSSIDRRNGEEILRALPADKLRNGLLVGMADSSQDRRLGFGDYQVSNLIGIDPENRLLAVAAQPSEGDQLLFCTRDRTAARQDLIRACTELREQVESRSLRILGVHYVSCVARGSALFGADGVEAEILRHNFGEVPVIGFFANGEIARERLYGFTGVMTLFVEPATHPPAALP